VRFIEWMPLDADQRWDPGRVLPNEELREIIYAVYPLEPMGRPRSGTSSRWRLVDGRGTIGFISPVTDPFCGDCNRIRLTSDGRLRTCLFSLSEYDLRGPMREGADDYELERIVREAVWLKELKHHITEPGFVRRASISKISRYRESSSVL
jgi:GTP 3',8-cyclase